MTTAYRWKTSELLPALCIVECQTRDRTTIMCITVFKYLATGF